MLQVVPAVLTDSVEVLEEKIRVFEIMGKFKKLHLDIIDGEFAENKTVSLEAVSSIETSMAYDIHLMVSEPVLWIDRAVAASCERVIGQIEKMGDQEAFVKKVLEAGLKPGLAVDLETPVEDLAPMVISEVDTILLMGVRAGFGGQEFNAIVLDKIEKLGLLRDAEGATFKICVDGGINSQNIKQIEEAGADEAAVGEALEEVSGD